MNIAEYKAPDRKGLRSFGLLVGLIFIGVFGLGLPLLRHHALPYWPWIPGAPLVVLGLVAPSLLGPIHRVWMTVGGALGWVNSRIILSILFFLLVTPLGLLRRLLGKDSLGRRFDRSAISYRKESVVTERERMKEPF